VFFHQPVQRTRPGIALPVERRGRVHGRKEHGKGCAEAWSSRGGRAALSVISCVPAFGCAGLERAVPGATGGFSPGVCGGGGTDASGTGRCGRSPVTVRFSASDRRGPGSPALLGRLRPVCGGKRAAQGLDLFRPTTTRRRGTGKSCGREAAGAQRRRSSFAIWAAIARTARAH
jgi:hypothetical protein